MFLGVVPLGIVDTVAASFGATVLVAGVFVLGLMAVALCTFVLVTAYRRLDDEVSPGDGGTANSPIGRHWFILLWSVTALAYGIETMSASAALVLGNAAGLWTARTYFLWHVVDTLPVFTVTDTLDLGRPTLALEAAGVMALVLKVALILPLFRMAVATFRIADGSGDLDDPRGSRIFTPRVFRAHPERAPQFHPLKSASRSVGVIVLCGGVLGLMLTVCNWMGPVSDRIASVAPAAPARWIRAAGDGVLAFLGSWIVQTTILVVLSTTLIVSTVRIVHRLLRVDLGVLSRVTVGVTVLFASLVTLVLVFSTAVAVDLTITCLIEQRPPMVEAFGHLEWYAWHSLDVVPELTVPRVLDWSAPGEPSAIWSGLLLLFVKLVALLVIAVPVARVARAARHTWSGRIA